MKTTPGGWGNLTMNGYFILGKTTILIENLQMRESVMTRENGG